MAACFIVLAVADVDPIYPYFIIGLCFAVLNSSVNASISLVGMYLCPPPHNTTHSLSLFLSLSYSLSLSLSYSLKLISATQVARNCLWPSRGVIHFGSAHISSCCGNPSHTNRILRVAYACVGLHQYLRDSNKHPSQALWPSKWVATWKPFGPFKDSRGRNFFSGTRWRQLGWQCNALDARDVQRDHYTQDIAQDQPCAATSLRARASAFEG